MQKSGIFNFEFMTNLNVPLDSAYIFRLYAVYYTVLRDFYQGVFLAFQSFDIRPQQILTIIIYVLQSLYYGQKKLRLL